MLAMIAIGVFGPREEASARGVALVASRQGLSFADKDPFSTLGEPFVLFSPGDGRGVENVLWGVWQGTDLRAFDDCYYRESRGAQGHTSRAYPFDRVRLCLAARCPHLDRPASRTR